jgi:hypothetical protein
MLVTEIGARGPTDSDAIGQHQALTGSAERLMLTERENEQARTPQMHRQFKLPGALHLAKEYISRRITVFVHWQY